MLGRRDAPSAIPTPGDSPAINTNTNNAQAQAHPAHRFALSGNRKRSQSENTFGQLSLGTGFRTEAQLHSDGEEERERANSVRGAGSTTPPLAIAGGGGTGIPTSGLSIHAAASASFVPTRSRFGRREFFMQNRDSPLSSDDEDAEMQMYSTSYAGPRDLSNYTFEMAQMTGYLEKQSVKNPEAWKRRWFVMHENALFFYRAERDAIDTKPSDRTCCGTIQLDNVHSVTTAKDFGVGAFQIRVPERKYILRADTKECMHDWLFNFQKSIANIISVLLRTKSDHRFHRAHPAASRRSFSKVSRSVSLDYQEYTDYGRMSADFPSHHFQYGLVDAENYSDDSLGDNNHITRTSPRRAASPLGFAQYGPRSPVSMFDFDPPSFDSLGDDTHGPADYYAGQNGPLIEGKDEDEDEHEHEHDRLTPLPPLPPPHASPSPPTKSESPIMRPTFSPPVSVGKYIPRFLRDRKNAEESVPPTLLDAAPPTRLLGPPYGVTSLIGVRDKQEDVCCCVPDLNDLLKTDEYAKHSLYALFDGHCGVRAAKFLDERLVRYLCEHEAFMSNARQAFFDCFKRIDDEFLAKATTEMMDDGSTAAVVLIRGNKLLTANVGDSRAVVSVNGVALDVIEEQTPGRPDERERIERLGGWVKEERELQMSKLHSMDLSDPRIQQKAERVVRWVSVYRVNGELAVSRAIGDMGYKGTALTDYADWGFPDGHDRQFHGDLVVCEPEFKEIEITPEVNFLVLACDGLWDTITSQEAVNHVKEKITEGCTTSQISNSLADLAIRSGTSDNVSVIIVLFQH